MKGCNICKGEGWVDSKYHGPSVCPGCKGSGMDHDESRSIRDSQLDTWDDLVRTAFSVSDSNAYGIALNNEEKKFSGMENFSVIVHLLFELSVVPSGGAIYYHVAGKLPGPRLSQDKLRMMGYLLDKEGKILTASDIPIGQIYLTLQHWGGEGGFRKWHMARPIEINPSRNGNPLFMDENMVSFRAHYANDTQLKRSFEHLRVLVEMGDEDEGISSAGRIVNFLLADGS